MSLFWMSMVTLTLAARDPGPYFSPVPKMVSKCGGSGSR